VPREYHNSESIFIRVSRALNECLFGGETEKGWIGQRIRLRFYSNL
jgi:hypothetical protein